MNYRSITYPGFDGATRALVVVRHEADSTVADALEHVRQLTVKSLVRSLLVATAEPLSDAETGDAWRALDGVLIANGDTHDVQPLDALHRAGAINRLDVVQVASSSLESGDAEALAGAASDFFATCERLAPPSIEVSLHRVLFPDYEALASDDYPTGSSGPTIVVIPEDRRTPEAMALPLDATDTAKFTWHIAIELLSLCGLWTTMVGCPLERIQVQVATSEVPLVTLTRCMVRAARLSYLSPPRMIGSDENLPLPAGMKRTPTPASMALEAVTPKSLDAPSVFPEAFRLPPEDLGEAPEGITSYGSRHWLNNIIDDVRRFPQRMRQRLRHEMSGVVGETISKLLESDPGLERLWQPHGRHQNKRADDYGAHEYETEEFEAHEPDTDESFSAQPETDEFETHFEDYKLESSEPEQSETDERDVNGVFAEHPEAQDSELQHGVAPEAPSTDHHEPTSDPETREADSKADAARNPEFSCGIPPSTPEVSSPDNWHELLEKTFALADAAEVGQDLRLQSSGSADHALVSKQHLTVSGDDESLEQVLESLSLDDDSQPTVLGHINAEFARQKQQAKARVTQSHTRLRSMDPNRHLELQDVPEMSKVVPFCLLFGALITALGWLTLFDPIHELLNFDTRLRSGAWRARIFTAVTAVFCLSLLILNLPRESKRQQTHLQISLGGLVLAVVGLLMWPAPIENLLKIDITTFEPAWVPPVFLVFVIVMLVWLAIAIDPRSRSTRLSLVIVLGGLALGAIFLLNDEDFRPEVLDTQSGRLLLVLTCLGLTLVATSIVQFSIAYHRERADRERWKCDIESAVSSHETAHEQADALATLHTQWLGTALAMRRIIELPFGAATGASDGAEQHSIATDELLKFIGVDLVASEHAAGRLRRMLKAEVVRPGWLYAQYDRAVRSYQKSTGADDPVDADAPGRPEECSYPARSGDQLITTEGDRWPFAKRLYAGEFDEALRSTITDFVRGSAVDDLYGDFGAFSTFGGAAETASDERPEHILNEVCLHADPALPGTLGFKTVGLSPSELKFETHVWWPRRLPIPGGSTDVIGTSSVEASDAITHLAVRVDISKPIPFDQPAHGAMTAPPPVSSGGRQREVSAAPAI